jgi:hypothetical protein
MACFCNIIKIIRFTQIGNITFNLAFGDLDEMTGVISDITVTNNDDSRKILATVAATVYDFTNQYPGSLVIAKGSTLSRTRFYRMGITNYWKQISIDFEVYGLKAGNWEPFTERRDYEAFLIRRK